MSSRSLLAMEILAIVGMFIGLSLVAAIPLVILLRSAEALSWRREHGSDAAVTPRTSMR